VYIEKCTHATIGILPSPPTYTICVDTPRYLEDSQGSRGCSYVLKKHTAGEESSTALATVFAMMCYTLAFEKLEVTPWQGSRSQSWRAWYRGYGSSEGEDDARLAT
jgi:hypothetical protein